MKTAGVKALVREVLDTLAPPYSEHVIDDVFYEIEHQARFRRQYDVLCDKLGKFVVNNWIGQWTAHALGKTGETQVASRRSTLNGSYSLLDTDMSTIARRPDEQQALQMMADYYRANKDDLPADIRTHRDEIVELLMDGFSAEAAFGAVARRKP